MGKENKRVCPICGSENIVTSFDAGGLAFCTDCDWHVGYYSPEFKKAILSMFEKIFNENDHGL